MIEEKEEDRWGDGPANTDIPEAIRDYDWYQVFSWSSGEMRGTSGNGGELPEWAEGEEHKGTAEPFSRLDVAEVFTASEGERDERSWLAFGRLKDGRFFFIAASCDYTGWDCLAGGRSYVAASREKLEQMVMTADERERLFPKEAAS